MEKLSDLILKRISSRYYYRYAVGEGEEIKKLWKGLEKDQKRMLLQTFDRYDLKKFKEWLPNAKVNPLKAVVDFFTKFDPIKKPEFVNRLVQLLQDETGKNGQKKEDKARVKSEITREVEEAWGNLNKEEKTETFTKYRNESADKFSKWLVSKESPLKDFLREIYQKFADGESKINPERYIVELEIIIEADGLFSKEEFEKLEKGLEEKFKEVTTKLFSEWDYEKLKLLLDNIEEKGEFNVKAIEALADLEFDYRGGKAKFKDIEGRIRNLFLTFLQEFLRRALTDFFRGQEEKIRRALRLELSGTTNKILDNFLKSTGRYFREDSLDEVEDILGSVKVSNIKGDKIDFKNLSKPEKLEFGRILVDAADETKNKRQEVAQKLHSDLGELLDLTLSAENRGIVHELFGNIAQVWNGFSDLLTATKELAKDMNKYKNMTELKKVFLNDPKIKKVLTPAQQKDILGMPDEGFKRFLNFAR